MLSELIRKTVTEEVADWKAEHGESDTGTRGFTMVLVNFSRKRELKAAFEAEGVLGGEWASDDRKEYVINFDKPYFTTNIEYHKKIAYAVVDLLRKEYPDLEVRVYSCLVD